jgi:hypothetical protein
MGLRIYIDEEEKAGYVKVHQVSTWWLAREIELPGGGRRWKMK